MKLFNRSRKYFVLTSAVPWKDDVSVGKLYPIVLLADHHVIFNANGNMHFPDILEDVAVGFTTHEPTPWGKFLERIGR